MWWIYSIGSNQASISRAKGPSKPVTEIRLKLTPSFAFKWLVPKLHDFNRQYPELKVQTFADGALS